MKEMFLEVDLAEKLQKDHESNKLEGKIPTEPQKRPFIEELIPRWLTVGMAEDITVPSEEL